MTDTPAFFIRDLPIHGELILAPMSGYNDQPFRRLCREFGAALVYTGLLVQVTRSALLPGAAPIAVTGSMFALTVAAAVASFIAVP